MDDTTTKKKKKKIWFITGKDLIERRTTKMLIEDALLTRFQDERTRQEKTRKEFFARKVEELLVLRTQQRDIIFDKFHASMHEAKLREQYAISMQRALRASWHNILGLEFFAEEKKIKMESKIVTHFNKEESEGAAQEIVAFESKGYELGAEEAPAPPGGKKDAKKDAKKPPPPPAKKGSKMGAKVEEGLPALDPKVIEEKGQAYLEDIKVRKTKENADKIEMMKKQRQEMLEQQEAQRLKEEEEAKKKAEEDAVIRAAEEAAAVEEQKKVDEEQKAEIDRRLVQETEIEAKRLDEWNLIRSQQHECFMMWYNDVADEINKEYDERMADINKNRKKRWQKHHNFCFDIILQFVSMAECITEYRVEMGRNLPIHEFREWKTLFIKGAILPVRLPQPPPPEEPPSEKEIRLAKESMMEYLDEKGEYASPEGVEPIKKNMELGQFLVEIEELADSLQPPFERPDLSKFTLMLSVVGVPCAGKTAVAKHLEAEYGLTRFVYDQVQALAVAFGTAEAERLKTELKAAEEEKKAQLATNPTTPTDEAKEEKEASKDGVVEEEAVDLLANLPLKAKLGLQAKSAIEKNEPVPDNVVAQLMLLTMLHPEEYVPLADATAAAPAAKGGKPAAKPPPAKKPSIKGGKGAPTAGVVKQLGFILDGFPRSSGQAAALEKCLTGLDFEAHNAKKENASKIAPPPDPEVMKPQVSGLDAYLVVEPLPDDELVKRLMESVLDPQTGIIYHPQKNPVPVGDKTGIVERLEPVESEEAVRETIGIATGIFTPLQEILGRFSNVHPVRQHPDESGKLTPNVQEATAVITGLIETKAKQGASANAGRVANEAIDVATQASKEVEVINKAAKEVAKVFFTTKLAEVEAARAPPAEGAAAAAPDPKAAKGKPPPPKDKASDAIAKKLDEVTKLVAEAQVAVAEAAAAAELAQKHAEDAEIMRVAEGGPEAASFCREEAEKATEATKQAAAKAVAAREKATALVESAKNIAEGKVEEPPPKGDKGKAPPPAKGAKEAPKEAEKPPEAPPVVPKPPPDPKVIARARNAEAQHKQWHDLEEKYLKRLQEGFRILRRERVQTIPLLIEAKRNFVDVLKQLNGKQELFENFQERYNRIELSHRRDKDMLKRLCKEGAKFADILRTLCQERLQGYDAKHNSDLFEETECIYEEDEDVDEFQELECMIVPVQNGKETEQRWLEDLLDDRTATFTGLFTLLVQAELDRHLESCSLLHEHRTNTVGSNFSQQFRCSLYTSRRQPTWRFVTPKWLPPLEGSFPDFHVVLSEALAKACNMLDVIAGRASGGLKKQPRKPHTRRMSGRRSTWMRVRDPTFREEMYLDPDVHPAIAREHQIFYYRLELIARKACTYLAELQPVCDGAYGYMDDWLTLRCNAESELVEEVISVIEDAVRESIPLWYRLWMELDEFKVDEEDIVAIVHVPPEPIIDLTPWHILVMESLTKTFKTFKSGFATTAKVMEATLQAIDEVYMMWRNHPDNTIYPRLPRYKSRRYGHFQHWANLAHDILEQSTGEKEPGYTTVIEWRGFLISLTDAHFDYLISAATIDDILRARIDFLMKVVTKQPGDPTEGVMTLEDFLKTEVWFDERDKEPEEDYSDTDEEEPAKAGKYDFPASVKTFIYSTLDRGDIGLPWQTLLLYLCRDASHEQAIRKAFTVLGSTMSPDEVELSPTELIQALYPCGVDGVMEAGCIPWTTDDMQDMLFRAGIEKSTPYVEPHTIASYVSSDPEFLPSEKDTVSAFLASHTSSHVSEMSESAVGTVREFLSNIPESVPSTVSVVTPWNEHQEGIEFGPQVPVPVKLTVQDCIRLHATAKLCGALAATFRQHSVHVMCIAPPPEEVIFGKELKLKY